MKLLGISFVLLFAEIMLIRWLGAELIVTRVFPNLVLTTALVGGSIGLATPNHPLPKPMVLILSTAVSALLLMLGAQLSRGITFHDSGALILLGILAFLVANLALIFATIGRAMGREFATAEDKLKAYSFNLLGSFLGVVAFAACSFLLFPPAGWLIILTAVCWLIWRKKSILGIGLPLSLIAYFVYAGTICSPYGKIDFQPVPGATAEQKGAYILLSNGDFFHRAEHVLPIAQYEEINQKLKDDWYRDYRFWLELPFESSQSHEDVLVLGSGSGNDVECALLHGAKSVDAVEINPTIASCGFTRHPDRPYADGRVKVYVNDARAFLRYNNKKYDLIQFAYLDPGATVKTSSFIRIDNFVYTVEAMKQAMSHLKPNGTVTLSFATGSKDLVTKRLYQIVSEATGKPPVGYVQDSTGSCFFLFGPGVKQPDPKFLQLARLEPWPKQGQFAPTQASTDDWPFLYMDFSSGAIILHFCVMLVATVAPLLMVRGAMPKLGSGSHLWSMFFMGAAFMLMETKSIIQLSLLFGSTWVVTSVVTSMILLLAFCGNLVVARGLITRPTIGYVGLVLAVVLDFCWHVPSSTTMPPAIISLASTLIASLPIFFGGIVFSTLFRDAKESTVAMAANVFGVAIGALLENACLFIGIRHLSILCLILYMMAALPIYLRRTKPALEYAPSESTS